MFFTQELLARRDSGFGLLWLAATLGSKSSFKKLPRRSVLTADIAQLCDLIVQPAEPLALRLSSNLMFGVVRVYKVKQEILLTDVSNTVTALKKVVLEANTKAMDAQLHMAQTSLRPAAVTIVPDSRAAHIVDYDAFVTDWDEYLNIIDDAHEKNKKTNHDSDSDEFDPTQKRKSKSSAKGKGQAAGAAADVETARDPLAHTLMEHHEHLLSASFELSFTQGQHPGADRSGGGGGGGSVGGIGGSGVGVSSSQAGGGLFDFDANPFQLSDGLYLGEEGFTLGDELARELGWGSPAKSVSQQRDSDGSQMDFFNNAAADDLGFNNFEFNLGEGGAGPRRSATPASMGGPAQTPRSRTRKENKENAYPRNTPGSVFSKRGVSPANSFGRIFLSQDENMRGGTPLQDITAGRENDKVAEKTNAPRKKKLRLLLDARTELTDAELKVARAQYLEFQENLRRDIERKKSERLGLKLVDEMMRGVPKEIQEPSLAEFWQENFKVQLEARSGVLAIHFGDEDGKRPARKRKRLSPIAEDDGYVAEEDQQMLPPPNFGQFEPEAGDTGMMDIDLQPGGFYDDIDANPFAQDNLRRGSSEEPGQARRASRPSSVFGGSQLGLDFPNLEPGSGGGLNANSQRSSLFPWDNAGPSSAGGTGSGFNDDHNVPIDHVEVRLRGSSRSRKSSVAPSQVGGAGGGGFSPIVQATQGQMDVDYEFNVGEQAPLPGETQEETQKSEVHLATLERNSFNFLEYAKMQYRTLPEGGKLTFDLVVPQATSTRHVASAAFYHCLVLATKDLLRLEQPVPYENIVLEILHI